MSKRPKDMTNDEREALPGLSNLTTPWPVVSREYDPTDLGVWTGRTGQFWRFHEEGGRWFKVAVTANR